MKQPVRPPSPVSSFSASTLARKGEPVPYGVLKGLSGLRAGWRLLIFIAMLVPLYYGTVAIIDSAERKLHIEIFTPMDNGYRGVVQCRVADHLGDSLLNVAAWSEIPETGHGPGSTTAFLLGTKLGLWRGVGGGAESRRQLPDRIPGKG
jgi:hypothetical protein